MHAPVVADNYAGGDDSLPDMTIRIGKITAVLRRRRGLEQLCAIAKREASTASTSARSRQFHASVTPRNAVGLGSSETPASRAAFAHAKSAIVVPPVSKNATSSPVARWKIRAPHRTRCLP